MKTNLIIAFVLLTNLVLAQDFEGTIKWSMKMEITDPQLKAQMDEAQKQMNDPAKIKEMEEQMNNPQMKAMMESNPQMKVQMEAALKMMKGGGGLNSMMPTSVTLKTKNGNAVSKMEGGVMAGMQTLYLRDKNESYLINTESKTYSTLSQHAGENTHDPAMSIKKTTETQKILNYTCIKTIVTIKEGDQTINQIFWTTNEIKNLDFKKMMNQKMGKGKQSMYYQELDGVPLKMEMTMPQGNMVMQVTEIKKESLSTSEFQIPTGFTETKMPGQH